jgi:hypothetical protein
LEVHGYKPLRKIEPVVLISPTSSIDRRHLGTTDHVVKSDNFRPWWDRQVDAIGFAGALGIVGQHLTKGMTKETFAELGRRLVAAHVKLEKDWSKRFGARDAAHRDVEGRGASEQASADHVPSTTHPRVISTEFGQITISSIGNDLFALRNEGRAELIELVRGVCKGRARWQPRYRNWLLNREKLDEVISELSRAAQPAGKPAQG